MERRGNNVTEVERKQFPDRGDSRNQRNGETNLHLPPWLSKEAQGEFLESWRNTFTTKPMRSDHRQTIEQWPEYAELASGDDR